MELDKRLGMDTDHNNSGSPILEPANDGIGERNFLLVCVIGDPILSHP